MSNFDETIHSPNRLRICAALSAARQVEFATLEQGLGVSKSLLSKQLKVLIDASPWNANPSPSAGRAPGWDSPPRVARPTGTTWPPCEKSSRRTEAKAG